MVKMHLNEEKMMLARRRRCTHGPMSLPVGGPRYSVNLSVKVSLI